MVAGDERAFAEQKHRSLSKQSPFFVPRIGDKAVGTIFVMGSKAARQSTGQPFGWFSGHNNW
jgi:hypothetical protein